MRRALSRFLLRIATSLDPAGVVDFCIAVSHSIAIHAIADQLRRRPDTNNTNRQVN